jgi:hypothetical protein
MDLPTFLVSFPEFSKTNPALVQAQLDRATRWIDPVIWTTQTDDGIGYLAAHFLAISVLGNNTKLAAKDGKTTYYRQYDEMRTSVAGGFLGSVSCVPPWL